MANESGIEWLLGDDGSKGLTVNPVVGCSRISPGCGGGYIKGPNGEQGGCWAEHLVSTRMSKNPKLPMYADLARPDGGWSGVVKLMPERLKDIVALGRRKVGKRVFVCDMSDLFHDEVPFEFIAAVFGAMACAPNHLFYVLTKRPARAVEWARQPDLIEQVSLLKEVGLAGRLAERFAEERSQPLAEWPGYFITSKGRVLTSLGSATCLWCGTDISGFAKRKYCSSTCRSQFDYAQRSGRLPEQRHAPADMAPQPGRYGHRRVELYKDGTSERLLVHRLVLETFVRAPKPGEQACHIDGNPSNNALWNLRWGTPQHNAADRIRHGRGRTYHKLNEEDVEQIRVLSMDGMSCADIAKTAVGSKVTDTQIRHIIDGEQWKPVERLPWPLPNVVFGITCEDPRYGLPRLELARQFPARWRFVSVEPQLADLGDVDFSGVDLVVNGGEAGPGSRPFDLAWARKVRDQARAAGARYFFKQAGDFVLDHGVRQLSLGKKGNDLARLPVDLRIRENIPMPGVAR